MAAIFCDGPTVKYSGQLGRQQRVRRDSGGRCRRRSHARRNINDHAY